MRQRSPRVVVDSFALLAYLQAEPGMPEVKALLSQALIGDVEVYLSLINYGEVLYTTERRRGVLQTRQLIAVLDQLPIILAEPDRAITVAAAHLKARYAISYADAFALALAERLGAALVTGDPEFRAVKTNTEIIWLPRR